MMKSAFNGTAFCAFIICVSQSEHNSGETFAALKFGHDAHGLKMNIRKPPLINLKKAMKSVEKEMQEIEKQLKNVPNETTKNRLENDMTVLKQRLDVFTTIDNK